MDTCAAKEEMGRGGPIRRRLLVQESDTSGLFVCRATDNEHDDVLGSLKACIGTCAFQEGEIDIS